MQQMCSGKAGKEDTWVGMATDNLQTGNKLEAIHVPVNLTHYAPITRLGRAKIHTNMRTGIGSSCSSWFVPRSSNITFRIIKSVGSGCLSS